MAYPSHQSFAENYSRTAITNCHSSLLPIILTKKSDAIMRKCLGRVCGQVPILDRMLHAAISCRANRRAANSRTEGFYMASQRSKEINRHKTGAGNYSVLLKRQNATFNTKGIDVRRKLYQEANSESRSLNEMVEWLKNQSRDENGIKEDKNKDKEQSVKKFSRKFQTRNKQLVPLIRKPSSHYTARHRNKHVHGAMKLIEDRRENVLNPIENKDIPEEVQKLECSDSLSTILSQKYV
eukprot:TRINITY_DN4268_c0_g3_i3.p1 TRINITY_DN4268_c0_g3~~TRINITY_DN4268_c0_g3_i3.p1  ORF type:complete len:257 (-),score=30.73 TRINITY_DN4268_c0_g3_i3:110-823(-)